MDNPVHLLDLGKNYVAKVNLHTFQKLGLASLRWSPQVHKRGYVYAQASFMGRAVYLHRLLVGAKKGQVVDHINRDTLDCTDANLRVCTSGQNRANSRRERNNYTGYKGVTWAKTSKKWMAQIIVNGKKHYLGVWVDKHRAARAYDRAARKFHGKYAGLNFTDGVEHWDQTAD